MTVRCSTTWMVMHACIAWLLLTGCERDPPAPTPPTSSPAAPATAAEAAVARYQCARCHVAQETLDPAPLRTNCVGCHRAVHQDLYDDMYGEARVAEWKKNIVHLREVPSLTAVDQRLRRDWFVEFIQHPHDLRPRIGAMMPRFEMSKADAEAIADYFYVEHGSAEHAAPPTIDLSNADLDAGRRVLATNGCMNCHAFSGVEAIAASEIPVEMEAARLKRAIMQAPDLRHTRARMRAGVALAWLEDPRAIKPDAHMPRIPLTPAQRRHAVAYIFGAPLTSPPEQQLPERLPVLDRPVSYKEVETKVFKKICWHCHSDPEPMRGDGGPGNTGGLGFEGAGIDFSSYDATMRSARHAGLFEAQGDHPPKLVRHLMARHAEVRDRIVQDVRGMPLGLPPMPPTSIQLVETWIAQGARE